MAKKSIAERIYTAYLTGDEAEFTDENNVTREFTPEGLKDYIESESSLVTSVNGQTGDVQLNASDVGAASTGDLDARLSEAQRNAINALQAGTSTLEDVITALQAS